MSSWLWTWGGPSFGWREGRDLWTHDGRHVGRFYEEEIYGTDGQYLGEVDGDRLIRRIGRVGSRKSGFTPRVDRMPRMTRFDRLARFMCIGYEDFPEV